MPSYFAQSLVTQPSLVYDLIYWKGGIPRWDVQTSNLGRAVTQSLVGSTPIPFRHLLTGT
ncbi:MAG: hypothetical protein RLZZ422_1897 [Pseudomonadota bacterium]